MGTGSGAVLVGAEYDVKPKTAGEMFMGETIKATLELTGASDTHWATKSMGLV